MIRGKSTCRFDGILKITFPSSFFACRATGIGRPIYPDYHRWSSKDPRTWETYWLGLIVPIHFESSGTRQLYVYVTAANGVISLIKPKKSATHSREEHQTSEVSFYVRPSSIMLKRPCGPAYFWQNTRDGYCKKPHAMIHTVCVTIQLYQFLSQVCFPPCVLI